jgi:hypothetical protein
MVDDHKETQVRQAIAKPLEHKREIQQNITDKYLQNFDI